jgi:formamidopyrimidine-DNA glycosylase
VPELPEVETIKDELLPWVVGQSFTEATVIDAKLLRDRHVEGFRHELTTQMITGLERRGKYLVFHLSSGNSLVMHFRMTGRLLMNPREIDGHARATFRLSNGIRLVFSDLRRLGAIWLVEDAETVVGKLGPEPLGESFTPHLLAQRLCHHHVPIKAALIDQSVIAGIGNMYADEALFAAGIHPLRKADSLSVAEIHQLWYCIREVLSSAIATLVSMIASPYFRRQPTWTNLELCQVRRLATLYPQPCPFLSSAASSASSLFSRS